MGLFVLSYIVLGLYNLKSWNAMLSQKCDTQCQKVGHWARLVLHDFLSDYE